MNANREIDDDDDDQPTFDDLDGETNTGNRCDCCCCCCRSHLLLLVVEPTAFRIVSADSVLDVVAPNSSECYRWVRVLSSELEMLGDDARLQMESDVEEVTLSIWSI